MKTILLIPVKNEGWILDYTLSIYSLYADYIIVADQKSEDNTREICAKYEKVRVIENNREGHSNMVRWDLLSEARNIEGNNLILCIDADEILSPKSVELIKQKALEFGPGAVFSLPWIQTWKNLSTQRIDSVWKNNIKSIAFYDNRVMEYEKVFVLNDHTSRVPTHGVKQVVQIPESPLIHLHFAVWNRAEIKQAWYRCSELIFAPHKAKYINNKYSNGDESDEVQTSPLPQEWFGEIPLPNPAILQSIDSFRIKQIYTWFDQYGIKFFESLNIWHIQEFRERFVREYKRSPKILQYPKILIKLNNLRHWLRNRLRKLI